MQFAGRLVSFLGRGFRHRAYSKKGGNNPDLQVSRAAEGIPSFLVMEVMAAANQREAEGHPVIHLEVGQPATGAPTAANKAASAALEGDDTLGYTVALGRESLRQRISQYYRAKHGVEVPISRICVTTGSSGAFMLSFMACFNAGDKVAILRPGYPCYRNILGALHVDVVDIPVGPETRFQPTRALMDQAGGSSGKLKGVIIASPANPTGSMLRPEELQDLMAYCRENGIRYISDELYHNITYGSRDASAVEFDATGDAVVINSFSKFWCMTGWRLGWMVVPEDLVKPVTKLAANMFINAPTVSQVAGEAALDCDEEMRQNLTRYAANRDVLLKGLPEAGFTKLAPSDGAFYIYADVTELTANAGEFCKEMLRATGVAATPGMDFDPVNGHKYVRFSFCGSTSDAEDACARLKDWLGPDGSRRGPSNPVARAFGSEVA